ELEKMTIKLEIKGGEGGKTFGSVSSKEIAKGVADQYGKEIDKKKIQLSDAIKTEGTHEVTVKLHPKVSAKLKVHVTAV
ncbi:MAG: 50S ribosomal protein L9, partial [Lachnospiraceae bacterium]|nr:50S ribosomal protein L9 [Lachnospiraceae bacterium]